MTPVWLDAKTPYDLATGYAESWETDSSRAHTYRNQSGFDTGTRATSSSVKGVSATEWSRASSPSTSIGGFAGGSGRGTNAWTGSSGTLLTL